MKKILHHINEMHIFFAGLALVLLAQIPFLILGERSIVPYHDQLDGELIAYIYQAKYLFSGQNIIPEFLNGAAKTALLPPAPLAVLLFRAFSPFVAYMIMQILGQVIAYAGMFLLAERCKCTGFVSVVVALLYAFLPFLPVYGLSQYGAPMMLVCLIALYKGQYKRRSLFYIALYAAMSSLVLCGFAWLIAGVVAVIVLAIRKQRKELGGLSIGFGLLLVVYLLENLSLVLQMLGIGGAEVSHKSEYVLNGGGFLSTFWGYLQNNAEHSEDYHVWILYATCVVLIFGFLLRKKCSDESLSKLRIIAISLTVLIAMYALAAFWDCGAGVAIRSHLGALGAFQLSRVMWLAPMLWYLILGLILALLWENKTHFRVVGYVAAGVFCCWMGIVCLKNSMVKPCVQEILLPDYETLSWSDYLALGVMEQAEQFIYETTGMEMSEYKVASLGIDPSAALYHGFYCVDGYSNNYDLEYKHAFRKVIAPELERNDWLLDYYDNWGNRCYLYSAEIPGYFNIEKGSFWYNDLQIDTQALADLGCDYILSAAYVVNAEEKSLKLLREEAFETAESYYRIYIYEIEE